MITVFNRKALYRNTDAEATAAVWSALRASGIPYEVHTGTPTSSFRRMFTHTKNMNFNMGGIPASWTERPGNYLYTVYVKKRDYDRAKELCEL